MSLAVQRSYCRDGTAGVCGSCLFAMEGGSQERETGTPLGASAAGRVQLTSFLAGVNHLTTGNVQQV